MRHRENASHGLKGAATAALLAVACPFSAVNAGLPLELAALESACEGNGLASGTWRTVLEAAGWQALAIAPTNWEAAFFPNHTQSAAELPFPVYGLLATADMRSKVRDHWNSYDRDHIWFYAFGTRLHLVVWQDQWSSAATKENFLTQRCELAAFLGPADQSWAGAIMDQFDGRANLSFASRPVKNTTFRAGSYFLPPSSRTDIDLVSGTYLLLRAEVLNNTAADQLVLFRSADIGIASEVTP